MDASFDFVRRIVPATETTFMVPAGGFTGPADFGVNLVAWYDATTGVFSDAGTTPANNDDTVQQWNDQSGNGYHIKQPTGGNRPTYKTAGLNSLPAIQFIKASSTTLITDSETVAAMGDTNTHAAFIVVSLGAVGFNDVLLEFIGNGQSAGWNNTESVVWAMCRNSNDLTAFANGADRGGNQSIGSGNPGMYSTVFDGVNAITYLNNASAASTLYNQTLDAPGTINVGGGVGGLTCMNAFVSEIVIVKIAPSADQRSVMQDYFTAKWGF